MSRLSEALWYGRLVSARGRFTLRHMLGVRTEALYRPRGAKVRVVIRHGTGDPWVMHEVWRSGQYVAPAGAEALLRQAKPLRFVELGGHAGLFSALVSARYPEARIVSFEPDPGNAAALRRCIEANDAGERWSLIEECAATANGTVGFMGGQGEISHVAGPGEAPTLELPARDVLPFLAGADFAKLDIEGAEWPILADERFAAQPPRVMLMEWHSVPGAEWHNPKRKAIEMLEPLGFRIHHPAPFDAVPVDEPIWGAGVLWAWRP